eukprot:1342679-Pleurochrysis_carterae.AAC.2
MPSQDEAKGESSGWGAADPMREQQGVRVRGQLKRVLCARVHVATYVRVRVSWLIPMLALARREGIGGRVSEREE